MRKNGKLFFLKKKKLVIQQDVTYTVESETDNEILYEMTVVIT